MELQPIRPRIEIFVHFADVIPAIGKRFQNPQLDGPEGREVTSLPFRGHTDNRIPHLRRDVLQQLDRSRRRHRLLRLARYRRQQVVPRLGHFYRTMVDSPSLVLVR